VRGLVIPLSGQVRRTGVLVHSDQDRDEGPDVQDGHGRHRLRQAGPHRRPGAQRITGTIKDAQGVTLATIPSADQALYHATKNKVPTTIHDILKEKGKYTVLFQADAAPNNDYTTAQFPQGDGYSTMTVTTAGVVKVVGKLADGSPVMYSNSLSKTNKWPFFLSLYTAKGFLTGEVAFDSTLPQTDAAAPDMKWFKPAGLPKQANYPDGWPNGITVDLIASKYITPVKPTPRNRTNRTLTPCSAPGFLPPSTSRRTSPSR
jgi:hypothetical protein